MLSFMSGAGTTVLQRTTPERYIHNPKSVRVLPDFQSCSSWSSFRKSLRKPSRIVPNPSYVVRMSSSANSYSPSSLHELHGMKDIDGNSINPLVFVGKVVFAMNVASACGYTRSGYDLLKQLGEKYPPDDFLAVAIPCNSFAWQENGSPEEIKTFALSRANRLMLTERSIVNGNNPHPIVALGKSKYPGRIAWNFDGRFVFNRQGQPVARFSNSATNAEIDAAIQRHL